MSPAEYAVHTSVLTFHGMWKTSRQTLAATGIAWVDFKTWYVLRPRFANEKRRLLHEWHSKICSKNSRPSLTLGG